MTAESVVLPDQRRGGRRADDRAAPPLVGGGWRYVLPAGLGLAALVYLPFLWTFAISFTEYGGLGTPTWVGIDNYLAAVQDPFFLPALGNTLLWVVGTILLPVTLALAIAVLSFGLPGGTVLRFPFLLPYALSGSMIAIVWGVVLTGEGALNQILGGIGLIDAPVLWLAEGPRSTLVMIVAATWQATGVNTLLFIIGLQSIPSELTEAGRTDGASGWSLFRHITWPLLRPLASVVVALSIIGSLKTFDIVWVMTNGGPGRSSETLAVSMYREAMVVRQFGAGSAIAIILTVVVAVASIGYLRRQARRTS